MDTPTWIIRPAAPDDAEAVYGLLTQFVTSYSPQRDAFDQHFPQLLAGDSSVLLVAEIGASVVGYVLATRMLTLYANGPVLELQELMVAPEQRGEGIGSSLVAVAIRQAQATNCVEVTVPTRRARDFYLKHGFVETALYLKRQLM